MKEISVLVLRCCFQNQILAWCDAKAKTLKRYRVSIILGNNTSRGVRDQLMRPLQTTMPSELKLHKLQKLIDKRFIKDVTKTLTGISSITNTNIKHAN